LIPAEAEVCFKNADKLAYATLTIMFAHTEIHYQLNAATLAPLVNHAHAQVDAFVWKTLQIIKHKQSATVDLVCVQTQRVLSNLVIPSPRNATLITSMDVRLV